MLKKFGETNQRLFKNYTYLSFVQFINIGLPLITLPYIARVIGPEKLGVVVLAQLIISYFQLLISYGYNLTATREIAINRNDEKKLNYITNLIYQSKFVLTIFSILLFCLLVFFVPTIREHSLLYLSGIGTLLASWLLPVWYYMGIERMKVIALVELFTKIMFVLGIFFLIQEADDYKYVILIQSLTALLGCLVGIVFLYKVEGREIFIVPMREVMENIKTNFYVFFNSASSSLYLYSSGVFLSMFSGSYALGMYAVVEKIIKAISMMYAPISQALYPHFCNLSKHQEKKYKKYLLSLIIIMGIFMLVTGVLMYSFSEFIIRMVFGERYLESVILLQAMSFVPLFMVMRKVLTVQGLMVYGLNKSMALLGGAGGILGITVLPIAIKIWGPIGAALGLMGIEAFLCVIATILLRSRLRK